MFNIQSLNELPNEIVELTKLLMIFGTAINGDAELRIANSFDFDGDGKVDISLLATEINFNLNISKQGQTYIDFNAYYDKDELDWVLIDEAVLAGVTYNQNEVWRVLDELELINASIANELDVEV